MINNHRLTNGAKIGSATVIVDILPIGKCVPNRKLQTISKVTNHNTGGYGSAKANHNYMKNINKSGERKASWHLTVDANNIFQAVPFNMEAWHAGDSKGNKNSIGIEICQYHDAKLQEQTYKNAIELNKILIKHYNLDISDIVKHQYWSGKKCPDFLIRGVYGFTWDWFITKIKEDKATQWGVNVFDFDKEIDAKNFSGKLTKEEGAYNEVYKRPNNKWGIKVHSFKTREDAENFKNRLKVKYNAYSEVYSFGFKNNQNIYT